MAAATIVPIVLNLKNYDDWSPRFKTYLMAEDLWDIVEGTYKKPPLIDPFPTDGSLPIIKTAEEKEAEIKAWKMKNVKALYAIQNSCGDDTYQFIKSATTAKEAWDTLLIKLNPGRNQSSDGRDERILVQAYPTRTIQHDAIPELAKEEGRTGGHDESSGNDIRETFVKSVKSGDWDNAIKLLCNHRQLGSARISDERIQGGGTALHYALWNFRSRVRIIKQLVESMTKEDLEIQDNLGLTALFLLITFCQDRVDVAKSMVEKNDKLLGILPANTIGNRTTPLVVEAQRLSNGERMARYLYSVTPHDTLRVSDAAQLISLGFHLHRFDIACDLIQHYPQLGMAKDYNGDFPLVTLAGNRSAFLSGCRLNFWENLIYYGIRIKHLPSINNDSQSDKGHVSDQKENQSLISVVLGLYIRGLVTKLQELLGINRIYRMKLMHERVNQFLPLMFENLIEARDFDQIVCLREELFVAAEQGHVEYITHLCRASSFAALNLFRDEKGQNLFQVAAECRQHKVYNLIHAFDDSDQSDVVKLTKMKRSEVVGLVDKFGNNMLHTVGSISSMTLSTINHIRGAALQMQRELQWFKEVESVADRNDHESINKDHMTPREVFTKSHKELGKEAEESMKNTSTSCTVVGALIVTMMFAAAFTVPGGNNGDTGLPTFSSQKVFTTFIVSDAISLFSSTTSVIMFLGILTSRYSEDDFLTSLPTKMIIGLFTLFLSIATMMIAFSCALYMMLDGKKAIVIPSILLASVPVASFIWMQFPFLAELLISTFGPGIFDRNQEKLF